MRVDIDKPGRDDKPRRIDLARALALRHLADRRDAIPRDSDIGLPARPAGAIDHRAAAQDPIGHMTPLLPRSILPAAAFAVKNFTFPFPQFLLLAPAQALPFLQLLTF